MPLPRDQLPRLLLKSQAGTLDLTANFFGEAPEFSATLAAIIACVSSANHISLDFPDYMNEPALRVCPGNQKKLELDKRQAEWPAVFLLADLDSPQLQALVQRCIPSPLLDCVYDDACLTGNLALFNRCSRSSRFSIKNQLG